MRARACCAIKLAVTLPARPSKDRLFVLLVPIVLTTLMSLMGTAVAPVLLADYPLLLVALNPVPRHLMLATNSVEALPFLAVVVARCFVADPFYYLIGRGWGHDAIGWIERRSGGAGKLVRLVERLFRRAGLALIFVSPGGVVCLLAGAARVRPSVFVLLNLLGTACSVLVVRMFGAALADSIEAIRLFVEANVVALTAASVLAVAAGWAIRRWRVRPGSIAHVAAGHVVVGQAGAARAQVREGRGVE